MCGACSDRTFWRELTPRELEFGDLPRVASDIDHAEVAIAKAASPEVHDLVRTILADVLRAVKVGDMTAVSGLSADSAPLARALKASTGEALDAGKQQIRDARDKQTGTKLAMPPRRNPKKAKQYLAAKTSVLAQHVVDSALTAARKLGISQVARGAADAETLEAVITDAAEKTLLSVAVEAAREAIAVGRFLAISDMSDEIETLVYTAILDDRVCEVCSAKDGEEYPVSEAGQAPNPDCYGEVYGNVCRCAEIAVFRKD